MLHHHDLVSWTDISSCYHLVTRLMFDRHIGMRYHHLVGRVSSMDKLVDINAAGKHVCPTFQNLRAGEKI